MMVQFIYYLMVNRSIPRIAWVVVAFLLPLNANGQNIAKAEYFFDTDPGQGNGNNITLGSTGPTITFTTSISTASLLSGFHHLALRVKQDGGIWSLFENRGFYITSSTANVSNIVAAEYFLDTDPGQGNGTSIPVSTGANVNFVVSVPTTSLSPGFHFVAVRTKDVNDRWGIFESRGFYITTSTTDVPDITAAEYFFDTDPGNGSGTSIPVTAGAATTFTVSIPSTGLLPGFHFLAVRTKGANGKWGIFEGRGFYISSSTTDVPFIASAEYFFDADPGEGNGTRISVTPGAISNFNVSLPATGLASGFHFLTIRTQGADGRWGVFESRGFYVSPSAQNAGDIVTAEYFVDTDPGEGNGNVLTVTTPGPTINQLFAAAIAGVPGGTHQLGLRVKDADGIWSEVQKETFTVLTCTPPAVPSALSKSRCNSGTLVLDASGAGTGQVYRWYADNTTTNVLFTGAAFTTPTLNADTDYFVSVFDPVTFCESARVKVTATIITTSKPVLNASGTVTLCEGASFLLSAPAGFSSYTWSNGSATQQILVTANGNYSVTVSDGTCIRPSSDEVTFSFLSRPAQPVVEVNGATELCDGSEVTLTAPAGFATYAWSGGEVTSSITTKITGGYSVVVGNMAGCKSVASAEIVVKTSVTPIQPVIQVTGLTSLCVNAFTVLSAPSGFAYYQWSGGESTPTIVVNKAGNYSVKVGNGPLCFSPSSVTVAIIESGLPCSTNTTSNPNNIPPEIKPASLNTAIEGMITIDLLKLISDDNGSDDLVTSSLRIIDQPASGASAAIDANFNLVVDYSQIAFSGTEYLVIQVCDKSGSCTQQELEIKVAGDIISYNAVSPNGDNKNEVLYLEYIDIISETKDNVVTIYNRWGSTVFEMINYDNVQQVFAGQDQNGKELPNGTYFYKIVFGSGKKSKDGFITLRR